MELSFLLQQRLKNLALIVLSLVLLPLNTLVVICATLWNRSFKSSVERRRDSIRLEESFQPKTILVTGVSMSKGLALARLFHLAGHTVIGANCDPFACGRVSKSLTKFFTLRKPSARYGSSAYVEDLLAIIKTEKVDIWCSCSDVASAMDDAEAREIIEARTDCKAVQFDVDTIRKLHEKHYFIEHTKSLGLTVPDTHTIIDRNDAALKLQEAPKGRKYIMKPIGMDDANRGNMTLLPLDSDEETRKHLKKLVITKQNPWILQQYINGPEFCTHSLIINGQIKAFVACNSAELLMHYVALPTQSRLSKAMLKFTQAFVEKEGNGFTGHLSFDFMIEENSQNAARSQEKDAYPVLYPIECNPRVHTAVVLFNGTPGLADAYMSVLHGKSSPNKQAQSNIVTPLYEDKYFWIGHDLVEFVLYLILALLTAQSHISITQTLKQSLIFIQHMSLWRDGTFETWDPAPFWFLYHTYWPIQFWICLKTDKSWSRINVSTTKMFGC